MIPGARLVAAESHLELIQRVQRAAAERGADTPRLRRFLDMCAHGATADVLAARIRMLSPADQRRIVHTINTLSTRRARR